jgi:GAF domain-containing protein
VDNDVPARAAGLIAVAEELAGEFSLRPLLEQILRRCTELLGCDAGSICSVDEAAGVYRKEADIGVACNSGAVYPLTEGMTGAVVARRAPLWFARYDDVPGGHVAPESRATLRGVIGVPLEWRGRIIGACIVFSRDERRAFGRIRAGRACRPRPVLFSLTGWACRPRPLPFWPAG